jgi:hypothetical protein
MSQIFSQESSGTSAYLCTTLDGCSFKVHSNGLVSGRQKYGAYFTKFDSEMSGKKYFTNE